MGLTITRNGIVVYIVEKYDNVGRVFECYFLYRYGTNKEFTTALARTHIPICDRKRLEEYIVKETKLLAVMWRINNAHISKKMQK